MCLDGEPGKGVIPVRTIAKTCPKTAYPYACAHQCPDRGERKEHIDDRPLGNKVAIDDLTVREVQGACGGHEEKEQHGRDGEHKRKELGIAYHGRYKPGKGVLPNGHTPHGGQNVPGPRLARAVFRAVVTLMAEPYVRVFHKAALQSPLSPDHLFSREGPIVGTSRRLWSMWRTGSTSSRYPRRWPLSL